jgi:hypothetical protein
LQILNFIAKWANPIAIVTILDLWTSGAWADYLGVVIRFVRIKPDLRTAEDIANGVAPEAGVGEPEIITIKIACNHRTGLVDHSGAGIASWVHGIFTDFGIKPFLYVVDNASNLADNFMDVSRSHFFCSFPFFSFSNLIPLLCRG